MSIDKRSNSKSYLEEHFPEPCRVRLDLRKDTCDSRHEPLPKHLTSRFRPVFGATKYLIHQTSVREGAINDHAYSGKRFGSGPLAKPI